MDGTLFLTLFLVLGGGFTLWCSIRNYDWFFEAPGASKNFIAVVGRPLARLFFIFFSGGLLIWGVTRVISPPPLIPSDFIYAVASPRGVDLTDPLMAKNELLSAKPSFHRLKVDEGGWVCFWNRIESTDPAYGVAKASSIAGPDFQKGFAFGPRSHEERSLKGRVLYFDSDLVSCDNVLFSKHPLSSAAFAVVICTPEASRVNGDNGALSVFYCRAGTNLYAKIFR